MTSQEDDARAHKDNGNGSYSRWILAPEAASIPVSPTQSAKRRGFGAYPLMVKYLVPTRLGALRGKFRISMAARHCLGGIALFKRAARAAFAKAAAFFRKRPAFKRALIATLDIAPSLSDRLRRVLKRERAEQAALQRKKYANFALSVEPMRLAHWRALIGAQHSNEDNR